MDTKADVFTENSRTACSIFLDRCIAVYRTGGSYIPATLAHLRLTWFRRVLLHYCREGSI